jgi:hypothetical protein
MFSCARLGKATGHPHYTLAHLVHPSSLYYHIIGRPSLRSRTFNKYINIILQEYYQHRPNFFTQRDFIGVYKLLFDVDQLIGQYRLYGQSQQRHH